MHHIFYLSLCTVCSYIEHCKEQFGVNNIFLEYTLYRTVQFYIRIIIIVLGRYSIYWLDLLFFHYQKLIRKNTGKSIQFTTKFNIFFVLQVFTEGAGDGVASVKIIGPGGVVIPTTHRNIGRLFLPHTGTQVGYFYHTPEHGVQCTQVIPTTHRNIGIGYSYHTQEHRYRLFLPHTGIQVGYSDHTSEHQKVIPIMHWNIVTAGYSYTHSEAFFCEGP